VTEWVDGRASRGQDALAQEEKDRFGEIVFRFCFGSIYHLQHFNADAHPGNYCCSRTARSRSSTSA
jgi:predicted unusual protein kinase regulating ubiquinone biosynthesis (AarF/ABC1/UbiB family)